MSLTSVNSERNVSIRADLSAAFDSALANMAAPGAWWTGAERLAIAREARAALDCDLCAERKAALSPYAVERAHGRDELLPDAVVDMVHRIASDPGRLSRRVYDDAILAGIEPARYAETLGVIVRTVNIEYFHRAVGLASPALPRPVDGKPTAAVPDGLVSGEAWLPMLPTRHAEFGGAPMPNVGRAMSAAPHEVRAMGELAAAEYMNMGRVADPTFDPGRVISRAQMELIAGRVSAINECFY
jgi:hypothetical protein